MHCDCCCVLFICTGGLMWFWVLYRFKNDYKVFLVRRATSGKQLRQTEAANGNDGCTGGRMSRDNGNVLLLSRHLCLAVMATREPRSRAHCEILSLTVGSVRASPRAPCLLLSSRAWSTPGTATTATTMRTLRTRTRRLRIKQRCPALHRARLSPCTSSPHPLQSHRFCALLYH